MGFYFLDAAKRFAAFVLAAKIEGAAHAELAQHRDVGCRKLAEMVGAENLPPAHKAAVLGGIAAEIAKIAGAGQIEMAGRGF